MTKEKVRNRPQNAIGVHDDLWTTVKKRKLRSCGHISRSSGMAKTILQRTVKGARRGRQKKRWEDNTEWTEAGFGDSPRAAEERYCCKVICGASTTSDVKGLRWETRWLLRLYFIGYLFQTMPGLKEWFQYNFVHDYYFYYYLYMKPEHSKLICLIF